MTLDSCCLVHADQMLDLYEVVRYWETKGYQLKDPQTGVIHIWRPEGEDFEYIDELSQLDDFVGVIIHLWLPGGGDLPFSIKTRGGFHSEEYDFSGVVGEENDKLIEQLIERQIQLIKSGRLMGVLFDRRDYVIEALCEWK